MPGIDFAFTVLSSAAVSGALAGLLLWFTKAWIGERLKHAIKAEYDEKLESHKAQLRSEIDTALDQMRPGQLSRPIQVKDGVYILYLKDKRAGGAATLVNLKQAAVALAQTATPADEAAAREKLVALKPQFTTCATLEAT